MNYNNAQFEAAFGLFSQLPESDLPEICFSGRSNVGKSSLINKVFNRKNLARTSSKPGKTITINFYKADGVRFVDLPGYGYAKISKQETDRFAELMEGYFASGRNIKLVLQLVDMRIGPTELDLQMIEYLKQFGFKFAVALTKCDKLNKTEYNNMLEKISGYKELEGLQLIPFSAVSGKGVDELKAIMEEE